MTPEEKRTMKLAENRINKQIWTKVLKLACDKALAKKIDIEIDKTGDVQEYISNAYKYSSGDTNA